MLNISEEKCAFKTINRWLFAIVIATMCTFPEQKPKIRNIDEKRWRRRQRWRQRRRQYKSHQQNQLIYNMPIRRIITVLIVVARLPYNVPFSMDNNRLQNTLNWFHIKSNNNHHQASIFCKKLSKSLNTIATLIISIEQ